MLWFAFSCHAGRCFWIAGVVERNFCVSISRCTGRRARYQGVEVSMVSRGDSTLRGHFPGDLVSLEKGMDGESWHESDICLAFVLQNC